MFSNYWFQIWYLTWALFSDSFSNSCSFCFSNFTTSSNAFVSFVTQSLLCFKILLSNFEFWDSILVQENGDNILLNFCNLKTTRKNITRHATFFFNLWEMTCLIKMRFKDDDNLQLTSIPFQSFNEAYQIWLKHNVYEILAPLIPLICHYHLSDYITDTEISKTLKNDNNCKN